MAPTQNKPATETKPADKTQKVPKETKATNKTPKVPKETKSVNKAPTPTKPVAAGKKPTKVFDIAEVKMIVRPVVKKGDHKSELVGFACMPMQWGDWKLGAEGKPQSLGTMMIVNKDDGERAAMLAKDFEKSFDWQSAQMINCLGGKVPK